MELVARSFLDIANVFKKVNPDSKITLFDFLTTCHKVNIKHTHVLTFESLRKLGMRTPL